MRKNLNKRSRVYIVHCVDAEGPFFESLEDTFAIIESLGVKELPHTKETLSKLQNKEIDLNGKEDEISRIVSPYRLSYLSDWNQLEEMISRVTNKTFRYSKPDSLGRPYTFSWFIMDFVGFKTNPGRRPEGYHVVWDWYHEKLKNQKFEDDFFWHFHAVPVSGAGDERNTCWTNNDIHEQVLCRRILERNWFPSVFRAGSAIERQDLSFWLELFIPFDFSSLSVSGDNYQTGEEWDWRGAPKRWEGYHPDFYDYRKPGTMNRRIYRCLELKSWWSQITETDIQEAFELALENGTAILAFNDHDRRDIKVDIAYIYDLIIRCSCDYPEVEWSYRNALEAVLLAENMVPIKNSFSLHQDGRLIWIESKFPLFGPIPFLAIKDRHGHFYRDNPTREKDRQWVYRLRKSEHIERIGVAGCTPDGTVAINQITINRN